VLRSLLDDDVPTNDGIARPIDIMTPDDCLIASRWPSAVAAGNVETSQRITDVLLGALAQAAPDRIPAASSGTMNNLSFGGVDPRTGKRFAYYETIAGGMGAGPRFHGQSAVHTHMTNSWNTPVEAFEHSYPLKVRQYRVRAGSGGAGARRGGDGIVRELEFDAAAEVTLLSDRREKGPYGLAGGMHGRPGRNMVWQAGKWRIFPGKARFLVAPGARLAIETPGGGGHGDSLE
jgi:N-methylhydantoinase B